MMIGDPGLRQLVAAGDEDGLRLLALEAVRLAEADVSIPFGAWAQFAPEERAAIAVARRAELARRAIDVAKALQGGRAAAEVLGELDGGAAELRLALDEAHDAAFPPRGSHGR